MLAAAMAAFLFGIGGNDMKKKVQSLVSIIFVLSVVFMMI